MERRLLTGAAYLAAATDLLQRCRLAHPTGGGWEAADLHWWWRKPGATDDRPQVFWFEGDAPVAAAHSVDWGDEVELDVISLAEVDAEHRRRLWQDGLAVAGHDEPRPICTKVDRDDPDALDLVTNLGFEPDDETDTASWLAASDRPPTSPLAEGYRLDSRADDPTPPHHLMARNGPSVEERLGETSLYRPDLDLVVRDPDGEVAAYGLFWFDQRTGTGLVEPMRTEERHQRRGLARHVLTDGLDRLARLGATRFKISYEDANPASGALYRDVGFIPTTRHRYHVRGADPSSG